MKNTKINQLLLLMKNDVVDEVCDAIVNRDEKLLRKLTLMAMNLFLEGKLFTEELSCIGISPVTVGIEEKWKEDFQFKDRKLKYVLEELSAFKVLGEIRDDKEDEKEKVKVKRFILYLEGKDYEK